MCGFAGFTGRLPDAGRVIRGMAQALVHRGPDGEGYHVSDPLSLGHRRLAVIDLDGGAQPRVDDNTGDALAFNGEIYGYRALADTLRSQGIQLRDNSDTEVLFQMLRHHGIDKTLDQIDGMFAFAFYDGQTGALNLVRDRFGEKPLFYGLHGDSLVFASEIKAIRCHPAWRTPQLDPVAVRQYLTFEYLPGDRSGFDGIRKLPPGSRLVFQKGSADVSRYWQPHLQQSATTPSEDEALDQLDHLLNESVKKRLIADVPVGLFLSGGVDSGLLAAIAARHAKGITAYTVRMPDASYDETPHAAAVAQACDIDHRVVDLSHDEVGSAFETVSAMIDEPMADYSLLPTYLVCKATRGDVTVALGGDGPDELFGGYVNFKANRLAGLMQWLPNSSGRLLRRLVRALPQSGSYMAPTFMVEQLAKGFGMPPERQWALWMSPFADDEIAAIRSPSGLLEGLTEDSAFAPIDALMAGTSVRNATERLLYLFSTTYLPEDILTKVDRASMINSLEVRAPYLDRAFAEFALSLPAKWKVKGLQTKYLLKKLAGRYLPHDVIYRPKHGFGFPLADLLRGPLYEPVSDVLMSADNPAAGLFRRDAMEQLLREHKAGQHDHRKKLWSLYVLFKAASYQPSVP